MAWDPKYKANGTKNWNPEYVGQPSKQPAPYEPGFNVGPPGIGKPGKDGTSPTVEVTEIENGHRVTITAANGVFTFDLFDGGKGDRGDDGISPTVEITAIEDGQRISITDRDGVHAFDLHNGKQGDAGVSPRVDVAQEENGYRVTVTDAYGTTQFMLYHGKNGDDGVSPTVEVEAIDNGHRVTITDRDGAESFALYNGAAGVSPTISVAPITGGHRVTIVDASGTKSFDVMNGEAEGLPGDPGGYYLPSVTEAGILSWMPSKADMPSVPEANVRGTPGKNGDDGVSPTVSLTEIDGGHRVAITDKNGEKSFDVLDGATGPEGPNTVGATTATDITGILKGNGATVEAAVEGTDYPPVYNKAKSVTAATTLTSANLGTCILANSSTAFTITLPTATSAMYLAEFEIVNVNSATVTITGAIRLGASAKASASITLESGDAVSFKCIGTGNGAWLPVGNYGEA